MQSKLGDRNCKRMENPETLFEEIYDSETCCAENSSQNVKQLNPIRFVFVPHFQLLRFNSAAPINKIPIIAQCVNFSSFPNIARDII